MKFDYKILFGALALILSMASCSDDDKWQPGPAVSPDCMTVYFEPLSKYSYFILPTDSHVIPITISRANYAEAVSVPLVISSCPEGVSLPQTVDFLAGQKSVTYSIDATNMPNKTSGTVSLAINDQDSSPYGAGLKTIDIALSIGDWEVVAENVRYKFDSKYSGRFYTNIETLRGTGIFRIANFLNSGTDFMFTLSDEYETQYGMYRDLVPYQNFEWYSDDPLDGWYFYDATKAIYPTMYPVEGEMGIQYANFWGDGYEYFCFEEGTDGWGYLNSFIATFEDDSWSYLTITFDKINLIFDPFEDNK